MSDLLKRASGKKSAPAKKAPAKEPVNDARARQHEQGSRAFLASPAWRHGKDVSAA